MGLFSVIDAAVLPEPPGSCPRLGTVTVHLVRTVCSRYGLPFSIFFQADVLGKQSVCMAHVSHLHPWRMFTKGQTVQSWGVQETPSRVKGMLLGSTGKYGTVSVRKRSSVSACTQCGRRGCRGGDGAVDGEGVFPAA